MSAVSECLMETAKVIPDSDEENQPGLKDVMQRQQLLQHQELEIDMQESQSETRAGTTI